MRLLALAGIGAIIVLGAVVFVLLPRGEDVDCGRVVLPRAAEYRSLDGPEREALMGRLTLCSRLDGLTPAQLEAAFGPPATATTTQITYELDVNGDFSTATGAPGADRPPDQVQLTIADGRVVDVRTIQQRKHPW